MSRSLVRGKSANDRPDRWYFALLDDPSLDFAHTMQQARRHHNTGALPE